MQRAIEPSKDIARLIEIMRRLRDPQSGCSWDIEQTFSSIAPFTVEEAYEVADAIARDDLIDLKDELGDLLLQVVFHAQIADEKGIFAFGDVVEAITSKLVRRHPHVFGDASSLSADEVKKLWDRIKAGEKQARRSARLAAGMPGEEPAGLLSDVPPALPALTRADKLTRKAATVGFDWSETSSVIAKIREELDEVEEALAQKDRAAIADEVGDILFACANLARHLGIDPEGALSATNAKFTRRFRHIETQLAAQGRTLDESDLPAMEELWQEAKMAERGAVSAACAPTDSD